MACFFACHTRRTGLADLTSQERKQLYTVDKYLINENEESFYWGSLKITAKLLAEALHTLSHEKRQVILYITIFDMIAFKIVELMKVPLCTVQYRQASYFKLLKRYLEKRADEWNEL